MKILLSAYACEPNRGSEPGVGWEWANRLAMRHDVTVVTRANNRRVIEEAVDDGHQSARLQFFYVDLPGWILRLKKRGIFPVSIYYILWQLVARVKTRRLLDRVDLIHHVTFNGFRYPGAWWLTGKPVVLGPLGGTSIAAPQFKRCFGRGWVWEVFRRVGVQSWRWNPWTRLSLAFCNAVATVDADAAKWFCLNKRRHSLVLLETALPKRLEEPQPEVPASSKRDFLWIGTIEPWKAWQIAFEAFALAKRRGMNGQRLVVIGEGHQAAEARFRASDLGIAEDVLFLGYQSLDEVWHRMSTARGLIFSSVRDTSGNVVLEAMGQHCPVVCFKHQGVGLITDESSAIRVEPRGWDESVNGFAGAMQRLATDDTLVCSLGRAGRVRVVTQFNWKTKVAEMSRIYEEVVGNFRP